MTNEQQADKQIADAMESFPISTPSPAMLAYIIINEVMDRNREVHIAAGDWWEDRDEKYHLIRGSTHCDNAIRNLTVDGIPDEAVEDAENAITRLGMALAKRRMRIDK